jgi:hypothetical protein
MTSYSAVVICCALEVWDVRNAVYLIVEGDGEETAAPQLVRRIAHEYLYQYDRIIKKALNAHGRDNLTKPDGVERFVKLTRGIPDCAGVLILLDSERENVRCPPQLAYQLAQRSFVLNLPFPVSVVCAACEYESWFLYNLHTIRDNYLVANAAYEDDPEQECSAKEWLSRHMPSQKRYKETSDQVKMTFNVDIPHTLRLSRSFRRMVNAVEQLFSAMDVGANTVTPYSNNIGE